MTLVRLVMGIKGISPRHILLFVGKFTGLLGKQARLPWRGRTQLVAKSSILGVCRLPGELQHTGVYPVILRTFDLAQPSPLPYPLARNHKHLCSRSSGASTFSPFAGPTFSMIDLCSSRRRLGRNPRCQL